MIITYKKVIINKIKNTCLLFFCNKTILPVAKLILSGRAGGGLVVGLPNVDPDPTKNPLIKLALVVRRIIGEVVRAVVTGRKVLGVVLGLRAGNLCEIGM